MKDLINDLKFFILITLKFFFLEIISNAFSVKFGATINSRNTLIILFASFSSTVLLKTTTPPKALKLSAPKAFTHAEQMSLDSATLLGIACFIITQDGELNSEESFIPCFKSFKLLYESSFPLSCS